MILFWPVYIIAALIVGFATAIYVNDEGYSGVETFCASLLATLCWPAIVLIVGVLTLIKFTMETW